MLGDFHLTHICLCHKLGVTAKQNVGTASCHIGGNGNGTLFTCLRNDLRLALVILCIEHGVRNACALEAERKLLGFIDGYRTDKHGLSFFVTSTYLLNNCLVFALDGAVNSIVVIQANHRLIGGDLDNVKRINFTEFIFFGQSGTRHTRKLAIHTEVVLEGDGSKCLILFLYLHAFFCLYCLVQAVGIATTGHQTSRKGINDHNPLLVNNVINVAVHATVCFDCLLNVVRKRCVFGIVKVFNTKEFLCLFSTLCR